MTIQQDGSSVNPVPTRSLSTVLISQLTEHIGETIVVKPTQGPFVTGRLVDVTHESLTIETNNWHVITFMRFGIASFSVDAK